MIDFSDLIEHEQVNQVDNDIYHKQIFPLKKHLRILWIQEQNRI